MRTRRTTRREQGSTALEVAGMAPLVVLVIFLLIQAALALYAITTAQTAVRQAARTYSLENSQGAADSVLRDSVPGWMRIRPGDAYIGGPDHTVRVTFDIPDIVPLYDLRVTRETVMP